MKKKLHIVVGAGTSGVILSIYLSQQGFDVVLLSEDQESPSQDSKTTEATNSNPFNLHSLGELWTYQCFSPVFSKLIHSVEQGQLGGRQILYPRGKHIGGTNNINAMIFSRGHDELYQQCWPSSWNSHFMEELEEEVLRIVDYGDVETSGHMREVISSAPVLLSHSSTASSSSKCVRIKYKSMMVGGRCQRKRLSDVFSAATALRPVQILHGKALHVNFEGNRAISVTVQLATGLNQLVRTENGGEVVLCAGVVGSAQLLFRSLCPSPSSLAPATPLSKKKLLHTIRANSINSEKSADSHINVMSLPWQDHVVLPVIFAGNWYERWDIFRPLTPPSSIPNIPLYPVSSVHGWIYLDQEGKLWDESSPHPLPTCQLLFLDGFGAAGLGEMFVPSFARSSFVYRELVRPLLIAIMSFLSTLSIVRYVCGFFFGALVCCIQPHSVGQLHLHKDSDDVSIDAGLLQDERDTQALYKAYLTLQNLFHMNVKQNNLRCFQLIPGPLFAYAMSYNWFKFYTTLFATTYFHPCGTIPMRTNDKENQDAETWEVDEELRVKGVEGLRVADASVFPRIPTSPIAAVCMMVAVAAGKFLSAKPK